MGRLALLPCTACVYAGHSPSCEDKHVEPLQTKIDRSIVDFPSVAFNSVRAVSSVSGAAACRSSRQEIGTRYYNRSYPNMSNSVSDGSHKNTVFCTFPGLGRG